ncbi:unnamed protein product [Orchesella dallaii]|uniref:Glucose-methanol-choline oxidoreductase N-terminal domain-containing protein n=1 Tax=Orchesella dallaii TaxID=48710 RepID=A0ABP1PT32_9HEXA
MTVINAINSILKVFPDRWPIPLPASAVIVVALTLSINTWVAFDRAKDFLTENEIINLTPMHCQDSTFDYIIVGAGAAGMIVATRLANASRGATILLLEAGGEPSLLNEIPSMDFFLLNQQANTWIYNTTPQAYACGACDDRRSLTTRGRMLGGSTSTSFMLHVRGNREDFNRWQHEDAGGDPQWSYKALLPYFRKSEDYNGAYANRGESYVYHGKGGLLNIATHDYMPGTDQFLDAAREKGYPIGDYNGRDQEVFSPIDVTTQNGYRESTYRAFYRDTGKPYNLCIRKYAHVTKVNFANVNGHAGRPKAVGVTYTRHKKEYTVFVRKEVILSAGTIGSPKLLLLSGVGPAYDLQAMNIPVVMDLPVGHNLQDHAYTIVGPFLKTPSLNPNRDITPQAAASFLLSGTGAIAAPAGLAGLAFFKSPFAKPSYADLELVQFSVALYPELPRDFNRFFGLTESLLDSWFYPYHIQNTDARFLVLWLGRPKSVGQLRLASRNPEDNPIIDPQYLKHPEDLEALLYGFKKVVDLFENTRSLNTPIFPKPVPGCENLVFKSDNYYRCVIRQLSGSLYHHVGTCALGKVVDNSLRVKGINGLRVIDASVIPRSPNGDTQASTIMMGEKGADLIIYGDNGWSGLKEGFYEHDKFNEIDLDSIYEKIKSINNFKVFNKIDDNLYGAGNEKSKVYHDKQKTNNPIPTSSFSPASSSTSKHETGKILRNLAVEIDMYSKEDMNVANVKPSAHYQAVPIWNNF